MSIYLLGFGAVGESLLRIFNEHGMFDPDTFYVIDCDKSRRERFRYYGGRADHFITCMVNNDNCLELLTLLTPGDTFIDLAENIRNFLLLKYCLAHGIHYLNAADSSWDEEDDLLFSHFREFLEIKKETDSTAATSILEFGMNPGLVSAFVKAAIDEIIENDSSVFVSEHRDCLMSLAEEGRYAEAASLLKITKIVESDNDDQETLIPYEENVFYSTWNAHSFHCECTSHSQIAFGTEEALNDCSNLVVKDTEERWGMLEGAAADCRECVFSPQGTVEGFVTAHEELYTIREYLRFSEYAPTVYFVYSPCTYAKRSLAVAGSTIPEKIHLIAKNEIISGGESVGVILYGDNFLPRYFGSYLLTADSAETATAVQVSASLFAAYQYIVNHPHKGLLFPEDLDHREVLRYASMHLGSYISEVL